MRFDQQIFSGGQVEYIDVKGKITSQFKRNKKMVEHLWPVKIKVLLFKKGQFSEIEV